MRQTILIPYLQNYNLKRKLAIYFCMLISPFIPGCSFLNMNIEPIAATVTELSACREDGKSTEIFSTNDERIFACGYAQTVQPVDINIYWYYKDELVFQQIGEDIDGDFYSFVQPGSAGTFPTGNYRIDIVIGGVVAKSTEFRVE